MPLLLLATSVVACDAPEKSVGQESDSETTGCDPSFAPCGGSDSETGSSSSGGQTSDSATSGTTTSDTATSDTATSDTATSDTDATSGESSGSETGGEASLPDGFEETLSQSGCADMTVFGTNPDDTIGLVMSIYSGLVADAVMSGETYVGTHGVDEFDTFSVLVGNDVTLPVCNDFGSSSVDQEWVATAGSVSITIEPILDAPKFDTQGYATLELSGVEVTYEGVTETVADITFTDINVG